eukprot:Nk52_evm61s745 gene=Nk52_evmTU61s745
MDSSRLFNPKSVSATANNTSSVSVSSISSCSSTLALDDYIKRYEKSKIYSSSQINNSNNTKWKKKQTGVYPNRVMKRIQKGMIPKQQLQYNRENLNISSVMSSSPSSSSSSSLTEFNKSRIVELDSMKKMMQNCVKINGIKRDKKEEEEEVKSFPQIDDDDFDRFKNIFSHKQKYLPIRDNDYQHFSDPVNFAYTKDLDSQSITTDDLCAETPNRLLEILDAPPDEAGSNKGKNKRTKEGKGEIGGEEVHDSFLEGDDFFTDFTIKTILKQDDDNDNRADVQKKKEGKDIVKVENKGEIVLDKEAKRTREREQGKRKTLALSAVEKEFPAPVTANQSFDGSMNVYTKDSATQPFTMVEMKKLIRDIVQEELKKSIASPGVSRAGTNKRTKKRSICKGSNKQGVGLVPEGKRQEGIEVENNWGFEDPSVDALVEKTYSRLADLKKIVASI